MDATLRIRPSKKLGQNFLIDKRAIKKVIETANLRPEDVVLEIGPGLGALTIELAKKAKKVIALEKDPRMTEILKGTLKDCKNVEIVLGDILKIGNWELIENWKLKIGNYKVVANLPFYITAPAIKKFLEAKNKPEAMILIVQKEVAQRICAKPPDMNLLAVSVQFYAKPEIIDFVSKKSSWPVPKVDSAILKIVPHRAAPHQYLWYGTGLREQFFQIVRSGFSQPRKQLINNLSQKLKIDKERAKDWLLENNIKPEQRAETLSIGDWISLTKNIDI